ncbi:MAG TPA: lanthionine synthetase LanC family protein [Thermoanaerobaculia bacterium]|nr:lanthionine synthetase LanC family protein [Thermoanaerobaculia bacterium]
MAPTSRERSPALDAALDAARWLESVAVPEPYGLLWEPDPRQPALPHLDLSLYHGVSGVALFFSALFESTGDTSHRRLAMGAGDTLLERLDDDPLEAGLYSGAAGIGASLLELWRATGDARFRDGAAAVVESLRRTARPAGAGVDWNESTDIVSGSAGIGLFLLAAADRLGSAPARELAAAAGRRLVELGRTAPGGLRWAMTPDFPRTMPNFSHGTAGVAYFLATLHRDTVSPPADGGAFLDAALAGARHLTTIAEGADGGESGELCLIYHHEPGGEDLHYLSWCHGPAGTARLFHRLHEITGDSEWRNWVERSARAVLESGIPEARTPGYWNNVSQCCGAAGVLDFSLSLYRATGEERYLDFARRVGVDIVQRGTTDAGGLAWIQAEHRLQPELLVAQTGYMQGAAGVGMALLRLHLVEQGRDVAGRLPDSPW